MAPATNIGKHTTMYVLSMEQVPFSGVRYAGTGSPLDDVCLICTVCMCDCLI